MNAKKTLNLFVIFSLALSPIAQAATQLNSKVSFELEDNGMLVVDTRYLTNYILRGKDESTGETGSLMLIERNEKAVDFDIADLEWDGLLPSVDFKAPEFESQKTTFDLSEYDFPNGVKWQNSGLVMRGANLVDLVTKFPETNDERIDALVLFFLNTLTLVETTASAAADAKTAKIFSAPKNILKKLEPFAKTINGIKNYRDEVNKILPLLDNMAEQIKNIAVIAGIDVNDPELQNEINSHIYSAYNYYKVFSNTIKGLNKTLGYTATVISEEEKAKAKDTIADQYKKLLEKVKNIDLTDKTADEINKMLEEQLEEELLKVSTEGEKVKLVIKYGLYPISETLQVYKQVLDKELKELQKKKASKSDIERKKIERYMVSSGYGIALVAQLVFADEDIIEYVKKNPQEIVPALFEISGAVFEELITIDNAEVVAKNAYQKFTGSDGRSAAFHKIRKASGYMKAFDVGAGIGNKIIPLLWDLILGENYLETSIVEGKISTFGPVKTRIRVDKNGAPYENYANDGTDNIEYIAVEAGDVVDVYATLNRPKLFQEERSPWLLNFNYAPKTIYNTGILLPNDQQQTTILCVKKIVGNLDYAVHEYDGSEPAQPCGEGTKLGGNAFDDYQGERDLGNDQSVNVIQKEYQHTGAFSLPEKYRITDEPLFTSDYVSSISYTVEEDIINSQKPVQIFYTGVETNIINHNIYFVSKTGQANASVDTSNIDAENLEISVSFDQETMSNDDAIVNIEWNWGDGTSTEEVVSQATHAYEQQGNYTITVTITRESGQTSTVTMNADVTVNDTYEVTAVAGANGSIGPESASVEEGGTAQFTIIPNGGYEIVSVSGCGGTLNGNTFTTGAITANCQIFASFQEAQVKDIYEIIAVAGANGSIAPDSANVEEGGTTQFTIIPNGGYEIVGVSGCGGTLNGNTFTTGAINADCTISASFTETQAKDTYEVIAVAGANGSIAPESANVQEGGTAQFTITPNGGYEIASVSGCGGILSGTTLTTGVITTDCTISASFAETQVKDTYEVTAIAGANGSITPESANVEEGGTAEFTITPNEGYQIASVSGCGGILSGTTFTTGVITANCQIFTSFQETQVATLPLNDTGITRCANETDNDLDCSQEGFPGQDAEFGRDVIYNDDSDGHAGFSFTKLDANGNDLPVSATEWSCVKDNVTGLIWEVKTNDGGLHDKDNTYTWYNSDSNTNGGFTGYENYDEDDCPSNDSCDTEKYAADVNAIQLCGLDGWRMPSKEELRSIINYSVYNPAIDIAYFPNTVIFAYWTASPSSTEGSDAASVIYFNVGFDELYLMDGNYYVRLVHSNN